MAIAVRAIAPLDVSVLIGLGGAVFAAGRQSHRPIGMWLMLVGVGLLEAVPALQA